MMVNGLHEPPRSGSHKTEDSESVFKVIEGNSASSTRRVSGEQGMT